jgi:hypothetical protein
MAKAKSFDAASLDTIAASNKPFELEIKHPTTGEPTGLFISVYGAHSDVYRGRIRALADEALRKQASGKASAESIDKLEQKNIDALIAATASWRSSDDPEHIVLNGEKLDCSVANIRKLYTAILPIRDQVTEAINDLGNFMRA